MPQAILRFLTCLAGSLPGTIKFVASFEYTDRDMWLKDCEKHCVQPTNERFGFREGEPKYGWQVEVVDR